MDHFDWLPQFLAAPPTESVFIRMVRTLMDSPNATMNLSVFGRQFHVAKKVFHVAKKVMRNGPR